MSAELLLKEHIEVGNHVEIIALCSKVEVVQNLSTAGSYREIYHLNGKDQTFVSGIIFKLNSAEPVNVEVFTDAPVLVKGVVGEYRDVKQIHIESISPITELVDKNDLLAEMVDTKMIDEVNDILYEQGSSFLTSFEHLRPAVGLEESGAGTFIQRLLKFLHIGRLHYPELTVQYVANISLLTRYYLHTEGNLSDRFDVVQYTNSDIIKALLFSTKDFPEYEEFVKLHHLIMKPRGYVVEILDSVFTNHTGGSRII